MNKVTFISSRFTGDSVVTLLNDFPRMMGNPSQNFIAFNAQQRDAYVAKHSALCNLYISVYKFTALGEDGFAARESAWIDKAYFDFDESWRKDLFKLSKWCRKRGLIHRNQYSGRGSHTIIFNKLGVANKSQAVGNFQRYIAEELNLDLDRKIIGDIARIFRYPNSYNFNALRFCIPIPIDAIIQEKSEEWFYRMATRQQWFNPWSGNKLLDLSRWDTPDLMYCDETSLNFNTDEVSTDITIDYPEFPLCVQKWLNTPGLIGHGKFMLVLFLKDQIYNDVPFEYNEIAGIVKKCFSTLEFNHYFGTTRLRGHSGHMGKKFRSILTKDYYMPDCEEIKKSGFCPQDCGRRHPIYD